jgi:hypothetical protein
MHFRATIHFVESGPLFGGAALGWEAEDVVMRREFWAGAVYVTLGLLVILLARLVVLWLIARWPGGGRRCSRCGG